MNIKQIFSWNKFGVLVVLIFLSLLGINYYQKKELERERDKVYTYKVLYSDIVGLADSLSTRSLAFESRYFTLLGEKDSVLIRLQELVKNDESVVGAVVGSSVTVFDTVIKEVVIRDDSIRDYKVNLGGWIFGNASSTPSNLGLNLSIKNEYEVSLHQNKKESWAIVKNLNPYTTVTEQRAVSLNGKVQATKPKKFGIGIQAGYGVSSEFKLNPYIGLGLSYNIMRF